MLALDQIKNSKKKGFTLIELVIVLAIAALIMVIVFLAVGGAQRAQRDRATQDAAGKVIAQFSSYLSDNNNSTSGLTAGAAIPTAGYVDTIKDGNNNLTTPGTARAATATPFVYSVGYVCNTAGTNIQTAGATLTNIAVTYLKAGSTTIVVCKDNK